MKQALSALCGTAMLLATPALAHHSGAMFDRDKTVKLVGTIKVFQFTNPHSWIMVEVPDAATGKAVIWSVEASSPWVLTTSGITPSKLKPGDKVTVEAHPLRDGRPGGGFVSVTLADGTVLKRMATNATP